MALDSEHVEEVESGEEDEGGGAHPAEDHHQANELGTGVRQGTSSLERSNSQKLEVTTYPEKSSPSLIRKRTEHCYMKKPDVA